MRKLLDLLISAGGVGRRELDTRREKLYFTGLEIYQIFSLIQKSSRLSQCLWHHENVRLVNHLSFYVKTKFVRSKKFWT